MSAGRSAEAARRRAGLSAAGPCRWGPFRRRRNRPRRRRARASSCVRQGPGPRSPGRPGGDGDSLVHRFLAGDAAFRPGSRRRRPRTRSRRSPTTSVARARTRSAPTRSTHRRGSTPTGTVPRLPAPTGGRPAPKATSRQSVPAPRPPRYPLPRPEVIAPADEGHQLSCCNVQSDSRATVPPREGGRGCGSGRTSPCRPPGEPGRSCRVRPSPLLSWPRAGQARRPAGSYDNCRRRRP